MKAEDIECCPPFNVEKWDNKTFEWQNKSFIKERMCTFFHIPFPSTIGKKATKMFMMADSQGKTEADKESILLLFHDPSAFRSEMYLSVATSVEGAENVIISGTFASRVFSGPFSAVPKFIKQMKTELKSSNQAAVDFYVHYAYCPKCAKKYGNNYMILFAKL